MTDKKTDNTKFHTNWEKDMAYLTYNQYDFDFVFSAEVEEGGGVKKQLTEHCIQHIQCSDWSISKNEY